MFSLRDLIFSQSEGLSSQEANLEVQPATPALGPTSQTQFQLQTSHVAPQVDHQTKVEEDGPKKIYRGLSNLKEFWDMKPLTNYRRKGGPRPVVPNPYKDAPQV